MCAAGREVNVGRLTLGAEQSTDIQTLLGELQAKMIFQFNLIMLASSRKMGNVP